MYNMALARLDYDPINDIFLSSPSLCPLSGTISLKLLHLVTASIIPAQWVIHNSNDLSKDLLDLT